MPSFPFAPARLTLAGADILTEPARFTYAPARITLRGANMRVGPNLSVTDGDRLPRLHRQIAYFDTKEGRPTQQMQQHWDTFAKRIEQRFSDITGVLEQIQAAQQTASDALQLSQTTAAESALTTSYTDPLALLTATSGGIVTIANHTRYYGDGTSVAVTGGSVSGFSPGNYVTVYYTDPQRAGGAVTYLAGTIVIAQTGDTHVVGQVLIPEAGASDATGTGTTPPAWKYPDGYDPNLPYGSGYTY